MKASIGNSFSYKGNVNIKLKRNNKVFQFKCLNKGTIEFLTMLSKVVAGYTPSEYIPRYVDFQTNDGNGYRSALVSDVRLTGVVYGEQAGATGTTAKTLFNGFIDKGSESTLSKPRLVLLDAKKNVVASVQDDNLNTVWETLVKGTEAVIEWTMSFESE